MRNQASKPSRGKARDAQLAFADLLIESTRPGYYGTVSLTMNVQDGHVQQVRVARDELVASGQWSVASKRRKT